VPDKLQGQSDRDSNSQNDSTTLRSVRLVWAMRLLGPLTALFVWLALDGAEGLPSEAR